MIAFGLDLTARPELPAVVARWQREITTAELQAGYHAILALADSCQCWRWLLDLRRRENLATDEVNAWMATDFLPQLRQRYAQPVRMALLVSPRRAELLTAQSRQATPALAFDYFHSADFTNEAAAYDWLTL